MKTVDFEAARRLMVERDLAGRGIRSLPLLEAFRSVPREIFVPENYRDRAYADCPLPIGEGQTISQPYMAALMIEALDLKASDRVLEVGSGSGYVVALLARLVSRVYGIERHPSLASESAVRLERLGVSNAEIRAGDGTRGWPEAAPFQAILVSAATGRPPRALLEELDEGGRLAVPVGTPELQELQLLRRTAGRIRTEHLGGCRFVPLIGENGWEPESNI
ncbi:MAG TPA: protein-L-isoaspartate(D-aspartate) O-methyltransferase [bacterium]|uniref:Protein-L-isoaspartate O-methyltransferase n=1 Tax=candidate division TA06 bacterium ADurb.Bin417 TaxID=1852828 RepID=A0A1V5MDS0_UNCT6|nr:MAG: Protein-L-isoaspartate O-methyltransferase [candidate division TA06 bacterium ADurb.Bin417]HNQ35391.1 protein-L-isoaspartate(D-aspartate) O-methyltransferase [bacterium]HNS49206.1 protein-L-isoaspartate(D-aspartate) O-methyltransferase [bacterium]